MSIFPIMHTLGGMSMAFPDVCKTPTPAGPVPIPYPNIASCTQGQGSTKVKINGSGQVMRKGDTISMTSGDEAGTVGGVVSNRFKGAAEVLIGNPTVKVEGKEAAQHLVMVGQNGGSSKNMPAGCHASASPGPVKAGAPTFVIAILGNPNWDASQRRAAQAKVRALNKAKLKKTKPKKRIGRNKQRYEKATLKKVKPLQDVDHTVDLQLGGNDVTSNMNPLNSSVNRAMGAAIRGALDSVPKNAIISSVSIAF